MNIIEELKKNLATFEMMSKLMRQKAEAIGISRFRRLTTVGAWINCPETDDFDLRDRYQLDADYTEEPEIVSLKSEILKDIAEELARAEKKFPKWPINVFDALAILGEEYGELQQAALQYKYENGPIHNIYKEGIQTAAMAIRFLMNYPYTPSKIEQK
jgi:hypothetical protein